MFILFFYDYILILTMRSLKVLIPLLLLFWLSISCSKEDFSDANLLENQSPTDNVDNFTPVNEQDYVKGSVIIRLSEEMARQIELLSEGQGSTKDGAKEGAAAISFLQTKSNGVSLEQYGIKSMRRTFPYAGKFEERTRLEGMHLWYSVEFDREAPLTRAADDFAALPGVLEVELEPKIERVDSSPILRISAPLLSLLNRSLFKEPLIGSDAVAPFNDPRLGDQWHYYNNGGKSNHVAGCDINVFPVWQNDIVGSPEVIVSIIDHGVEFTHVDLAANMWENSAERYGTPGVDDDGNGYVDDLHGYNFRARTPLISFGGHGTHVAGTIGAINNNGVGVSGVAGGNWARVKAGVRMITCQVFSELPEDENKSSNSAEGIKYGADNGAVISQNSWSYTDVVAIPASMKAAIDYFVKYAGMDENGKQSGPMEGGIVIFSAGNKSRDENSPQMYEKVFAVAALGPDYQKASYSNWGDWVTVSAPGGQSGKGDVLSTITDNGYGTKRGTSMSCPHVSGLAALLVSHYGGPGFTNADLWDIMVSSADNIDSYNPTYAGKLGSGLVNAQTAFSYIEGANTPPVITPLDGTSVTLKSYQSLSLRFSYYDPDGHSVTWQVTGGGDAVTATAASGIITVTIDASRGTAGVHSASVVVTDRFGLATVRNFTFEILSNRPPVVKAPLEDFVFNTLSTSTQLRLNTIFSDPDNDYLTYTISSSSGKVAATVNGGDATLQPKELGYDMLTLKAVDPAGETVSTQVQVLVRESTKEIDIFPNPVIDYLNIRSDSNVDAQIVIYSSNGVEIYSEQVRLTPFSPLAIDFARQRGGTYSVFVKYDSKEIVQNIVKL